MDRTIQISQMRTSALFLGFLVFVFRMHLALLLDIDRIYLTVLLFFFQVRVWGRMVTGANVWAAVTRSTL